MELRQDAAPLPDITFLTQDEVRRLFAVITGKRDRALFHLAYHHGLRASEVSLLQRDDVHAKQGRIYIPRVKGSIAKTYPLQPEDLRLVRAYLRTREDDSPYLFTPLLCFAISGVSVILLGPIPSCGSKGNISCSFQSWLPLPW